MRRKTVDRLIYIGAAGGALLVWQVLTAPGAAFGPPQGIRQASATEDWIRGNPEWSNELYELVDHRGSLIVRIWRGGAAVELGGGQEPTGAANAFWEAVALTGGVICDGHGRELSVITGMGGQEGVWGEVR